MRGNNVVKKFKFNNIFPKYGLVLIYNFLWSHLDHGYIVYEAIKGTS